VKRVVPVTWTKEQVTRWGKTCGLCTIAGECTSGVPPGPYYTTGKLTKVAKDQPPQATLFDPRELTFDRLPPQKVLAKAETKVVETVQVQLQFNMD
jgi:hypothetical protein